MDSHGSGAQQAEGGGAMNAASDIASRDQQKDHFLQLMFGEPHRRSQAAPHSPHAVHAEAEYLPLRVVPAPVRFPVLREVLQWQPHLASDPALHWFREVVKRAAQDIAPLGRKHGRAAV